MKTFPLITSVVLLFWGCSGNVNNKSSVDSTATDTNSNDVLISPVPLCFQRLEGTSNQDTTTLRLVIEGTKVTGDFNHIPFEKDSRRGTIEGTRKGDIIKGVWSFMQEGMNDTLSVEFKLSGNQLLQKNYNVDPQTGRQFLSDTSRFTLEYDKVDCKN